MKLKYFFFIGYLISASIVVISIIWAVNKMLIVHTNAYFIIAITILASIAGALANQLLLSRVLRSLDKLKQFTYKIPRKEFEMITDVQSPVEFKELADAFNDMSTNLKNTFASLEESEKEKRMMIAQLSHDIKTPITSIQTTVEGMIDGIIAHEEHPHYLQTISRQTERLNKLVEQLNYLTLNINEEGDVTNNQQIIFLDKLLIDILSEFQLLIDREHRDVTIHMNLDSPKIISNHDKLARILLNLVNNALKYSDSGTTLDIEAKRQGSQLLISVTDEGQGIRPDQLEKIFKRLYRVESSRNMATGGHGLGLYIAQELAHQLDGEITVKSEYGKGSTFTLILNQMYSI